jgi:6-pyruvoyltetrahydropterin/6-carboxytetrahydropterin synthase
MAKVRVTKQFDFEMAHALWNYDGPCKNLHGHSYRLYVTVAGYPVNDRKDPKNGMVIDFGDLKQIVNETIIKKLDHAVIISREVPEDFYRGLGPMLEKLQVVDYQPTCENMIVDFALQIMNRLPEGLELFSLRLHETATSYAEWSASDNK